VHVSLSGSEIDVPGQFLDRPCRRAAHGEVRPECVAQHVDTGPRQLRAAVGAHYLTTGTKLTR